MKKLVAYSWLMVCNLQGYSQHADHSDVHGMKGTHRLTLGLAHTHISNGRIHEKTEWIVSPSWAVNYDYWLSDKWAVGLQNELIMETFVIENAEEEEIEREYPVAIVPVALFKPGKHFSFIGGIGVEFAESGDLTITRLGAEYGLLIPGNWEAGLALVWDNAWDHYNSWGLTFTFSKLFGKKMR
jgi:hypothetical protein